MGVGLSNRIKMASTLFSTTFSLDINIFIHWFQEKQFTRPKSSNSWFTCCVESPPGRNQAAL